MDYEDLKAPEQLPEPGFYYHYKHDPEMQRDGIPDASIRNYAYEVMPSFGLYTEEDGPADRFRVEYRPLYPWAKVYEISLATGRICNDHRPASMFLAPVQTDSYSGPRFRKVTDSELLELLTGIRDDMYEDFPQ